ncbi:hypothetical protein FTO70_06405 [Methanosarcina sp. KYL-1]|nr:hypothetical protein [Methanosarcina sp. KYL-1]
MKAICGIGILVFMLIAMGTAGATTFYLTEVNDDYSYGVNITVKVDYEGNIIRVEVIEPKNEGNISNVDLKQIWIFNPDNPVQKVSDKSVARNKWEFSSLKPYNVANFGIFTTSIYQKNHKYKTTGPIEIKLQNNVGSPENPDGYGIAAHVSFKKGSEPPSTILIKKGDKTGEVDCSGKVAG